MLMCIKDFTKELLRLLFCMLSKTWTHVYMHFEQKTRKANKKDVFILNIITVFLRKEAHVKKKNYNIDAFLIVSLRITH